MFSAPVLLHSRAEAPKHQLRRPLTQAETDEIVYAFTTLDVEKTGFVSARQLKVALRALGFPVKKAEVLDILRRHAFEEDRIDKLDFEAFKTAVSEKLGERTLQDDMRRAFQLLDVHGTGKIDVFTLRRITKSLGMEITDAELEDMVAEFDLDKDGMINQDEFMAIMAATQD